MNETKDYLDIIEKTFFTALYFKANLTIANIVPNIVIMNYFNNSK